MKKVIILAISVFFTLCLNASETFKEYTTTIISTSGDTATVKNSKDVTIGASGVVIHNFDKAHSSIVARAIVIAKDSETLKIRFERFDDLVQKALPVPAILPKTGDKVILNHLYDRAIAIAPNYQTYKEITGKHKEIQWVHPDIFASQLFIENIPDPGREEFGKICKKNEASLIYFAIGSNGYFTDCNSFEVVATESISTSIKKVKLPFYTRIKKIESPLFGVLGKSEIENYNNYYNKLINK